jgi:HTH-type transcriptional regulator/antitoxin HigA
MAHTRPIRTEADHESALARIEQLMGAQPDTPEGDELDVLATLVDRYEKHHLPIGMPTPAQAVLFRMEQAGLTRRDLEPLLGGRAKVSEVLNGKRPLTLQMIRALTSRLGIPAEVLLQEGWDEAEPDEADLDWNRFPVVEMNACKWFGSVTGDVSAQAEKLMRRLREQAGGSRAAICGLYRKDDHTRQATKADSYALTAWCWRSLAVAQKDKAAAFNPATVSLGFLEKVMKLSPHSDGPSRARKFLAHHGIRLVVVKHLSRTHLDGAALQLGDGSPVVALTLRYDRLDNFWFCLAHELAHVGRHLSGGDTQPFLDDFSTSLLPGELPSREEQEADEWAREALIPGQAWESSPARINPTPTNVIALANDLGITPAIVAGRVRYERRNYRLLTHFVGTGGVRYQLDYQDC